MKEFLSTPILYHSAIALGILIGSIIAGRMLKSILSWIVKSVTQRTKTTLGERIFQTARTKITSMTILAGLFIALTEIRKGVSLRDTTTLQVLGYLDVIAYIGAVLLVGKIIAEVAESAIEWYIENKETVQGNNLRATVAPMTSKLVNIAVFLMAVIVVLDHFKINVGSLLVSLGVASLAVALAAQDTIANMIAGFVILIDRPFRIGDRIQIASNEIGDVQEIGLRSTRILNLENNVLVIPNSELVKNRIMNFTHPYPRVRVTVDVTVAYGTNIDVAKKLIMEAAQNEKQLLPKPEPALFTAGFSDTGIILRLVGTVDNIKVKGIAESNLRDQIYSLFLKNNIAISTVYRTTKQ